jgi:hypothetical protein
MRNPWPNGQWHAAPVSNNRPVRTGGPMSNVYCYWETSMRAVALRGSVTNGRKGIRRT